MHSHCFIFDTATTVHVPPFLLSNKPFSVGSVGSKEIISYWGQFSRLPSPWENVLPLALIALSNAYGRRRSPSSSVIYLSLSLSPVVAAAVAVTTPVAVRRWHIPPPTPTHPPLPLLLFLLLLPWPPRLLPWLLWRIDVGWNHGRHWLRLPLAHTHTACGSVPLSWQRLSPACTRVSSASTTTTRTHTHVRWRLTVVVAVGVGGGGGGGSGRRNALAVLVWTHGRGPHHHMCGVSVTACVCVCVCLSALCTRAIGNAGRSLTIARTGLAVRTKDARAEWKFVHHERARVASWLVIGTEKKPVGRGVVG